MGRLTALFPPGKGGGEAVAYGYKGKGILIHTITEGYGMPLANRTTAANDSEREQVLPLLDSIKIQTGKPGRPKKRLSVLAADKGYDCHKKRSQLRKRGIRPQFPKRAYKSKKHRGRPIKNDTPRFQQERCFAWYQRKYRRLVVRWERLPLLFDGFLALGMIHLWITKILLVG